MNFLLRYLHSFFHYNLVRILKAIHHSFNSNFPFFQPSQAVLTNVDGFHLFPRVQQDYIRTLRRFPHSIPLLPVGIVGTFFLRSVALRERKLGLADVVK